MKRANIIGLLVGSACFITVGFTSLAWQPEKPATKPIAPDAKAPAKQPEKPAPPAPPDAQPEMDEMAKMMPGEMHKQLAKLVGSWTTETSMSMGGQPMPAEAGGNSKGTSTIKSMLDGRFFHEEETGTMMGEAFTSVHLLGYNNGSKKFEATWVYTMSTGMMHMTGTSSDNGKSITFDASFQETADKTEKMKVEMKWQDDDHFSVKLIADNEGVAFAMETKYTRKK